MRGRLKKNKGVFIDAYGGLHIILSTYYLLNPLIIKKMILVVFVCVCIDIQHMWTAQTQERVCVLAVTLPL